MRLLEHFFEIIAPSSCLGCQTEGSLICLYCREEALPETESRCYNCNRLTVFGAVCTYCRRKSSLKHVYTRTEYTGAAKELVHKMKFNYSGEAADLIADELVSTLPALTPETLIVHVPSVTSHVRQRGFDHTRRIARGLSRQTGLRCAPALSRLGQHRQVGSKRQERITVMKDAFRVERAYLVKGAHVLLVDDVLTTGATLEAAAGALKAAGAKTIDAVIFARAK